MKYSGYSIRMSKFIISLRMGYYKFTKSKRNESARRESRLFMIIISIIILIALQFYNYIGFSVNMLKALGMLLSIVMTLFYIIPAITQSKSHDIFYNTYRWLAISYFLSMFMALIFWDQSPILTFRCSYNILYLGFLFILYKHRPLISELEKIVRFFAIAYMIIFAISLFIFPTVLFGNKTEGDMDVSRGIARFVINGDMFMYLFYFMNLNKYVETHKKNALIWIVICFLFIILRVTRQIILITLAIGVIYILRNRIKYCITSIVILLLLYIWNPVIRISDNTILGNLINLTETQRDNMESGDEYIRITEYKYFLLEYNRNLITCIFGNGMPHSESHYGSWYNSLNTNQKLFLSDVGYGMMYAIYGIVGLFLYIYIYAKGTLRKVDNDHVYARLFILFLIFNNIASSVFMLADTAICTAISLYIIHVNSIKRYIIRKNI